MDYIEKPVVALKQLPGARDIDSWHQNKSSGKVCVYLSVCWQQSNLSINNTDPLSFPEWHVLLVSSLLLLSSSCTLVYWCQTGSGPMRSVIKCERVKEITACSSCAEFQSLSSIIAFYICVFNRCSSDRFRILCWQNQMLLATFVKIASTGKVGKTTSSFPRAVL